MGCASSKPPVSGSFRAPIRRTNSIPVYHPPQCDGDTYHLVALTSTTLGSLNLDPIDQNQQQEESKPIPWTKLRNDSRRSSEFSMGLIEAKTWSSMMTEKIPKVVPTTKTPMIATPMIATPPQPGELPETINLWELMEGLEDVDPVRNSAHHVRSFTFDVALSSFRFPDLSPTDLVPKSKSPMWLDLADFEMNSNSDSNSASGISDFDPDVISTFRKSLEDLPEANPFHLNALECEKLGSKEKVLLYFTSLRGVRKTYEDCCHVRVILKGTGVRIDERDVSMHSGFKEELKELLGDGFLKGGLPKVFVGKKYIGGAEEVRRLHEEGQLEKVLECCEMVDDGGDCGGGVCEACGDIRFVPCETCSGSCKIFYEDDYGEEIEGSECGFQRCPDCNENGVIRCPICCD